MRIPWAAVLLVFTAVLPSGALAKAAAISRPADLGIQAALEDTHLRIDRRDDHVESHSTRQHRHQPQTFRPAAPQPGACHTVAEHYPGINLLWPSSSEYKLESARYWSAGCAALRPSCVMYPSSPAQVAAIVGVLGRQDTQQGFAVKSGGHNANPGFSSVSGGPLIALGRLDEVTLDAERRTVRVGPGNRWEDVTAALEGTGFAVVGGRLGDVGVGGNLVGGGLSFLSTQYGWAASNVLEYQLVLANATVVTVTLGSHPDLFTALRGGGNTLGIVTSFLLEAKPMAPRVWGGRYLFLSSRPTDVAVLRAIRDFTEYYPDPRAGVIAVHNTALFGLVNVWLLFLFYDGPSPPPGVFDNLTAFPALPFADTTGPKTYDALLRENNWGIVKNSGYVLATETTPLPHANDVDAVLGGYHARWREATRPVRRTWGLIASIVYQPIPRSMSRIARAKPGGDLLDLDASVDRLIIELDYSYWRAKDFKRVDAAMASGVRGIHAMMAAFVEDGTLRGDGSDGTRLPPLFMNDAGARQDYFGRLSEERRELVRRVKRDVDAGAMWDRTGGFRV